MKIDNKTLLFSRSYNGYYNWFVVDVTNQSNKKQLTKNTMNNRQITFNKEFVENNKNIKTRMFNIKSEMYRAITKSR